MPKVLVFAEIKDGSLKKSSAEAVAAARELGEVEAIAIGKGAGSAAEELGSLGVAKVHVVEDDSLSTYNQEAYASALASAAKKISPVAVIGTATSSARDFFPRAAFHMGVPVITDVTGVRTEGGEMLFTKPLYAGKAVGECKLEGEGPAFVLIRPNVFKAEKSQTPSTPEVEKTAPELTPESAAAKVIDVLKGESSRVDLTEAEVVVSGGRGMKSAENFKILEELADVLGGAVGASRAAVDDGFAPQSMQVGQTGKTVNPKLYIACGISGAIQHLAGMQTSKVIVAVNKDPDAPIFQKADYGIVGDLFEVVPRMTEAFKKLLAK